MVEENKWKAPSEDSTKIIKCNGLGIHNGPDAKGSEKNKALKLTQALAAVITEEDESD
jgi:hypothetical protein